VYCPATRGGIFAPAHPRYVLRELQDAVVTYSVQYPSISMALVLSLLRDTAKNALRRALHKAEIKVWHQRDLIGQMISSTELISMTRRLAHASNISCSFASCRWKLLLIVAWTETMHGGQWLWSALGFMIDVHHVIDYCYLVIPMAEIRCPTFAPVAGVPKIHTVLLYQGSTLKHDENLYSARKEVWHRS
jgi:hypothetical protein